MDLYVLVKFLHVMAVIIWVGAVFLFVVLGIIAYGRKDRGEFVGIVRYIVYLSPRLFIPSSLSVVVLGAITASLQWSFADLWVDIGLVGWVATFVTGNFLIRPRAEKIEAMVAKSGITDAAVTTGQQMLNIAKFDFTVLFVVVADMVIKPTPADWIVLLVMAALVVGSAFLFIAPAMRGEQQAAVA